jgi:hypothetical protein
VVSAFLAATRNGDFGALIEVLDPGVVVRADTGARPAMALSHLSGAREVAAVIAERGPQFAVNCHLALVNGAAGIIVQPGRTVMAVVAVTVVAERITEIDLILDPAKLTSVSGPASQQ